MKYKRCNFNDYKHCDCVGYLLISGSYVSNTIYGMQIPDFNLNTSVYLLLHYATAHYPHLLTSCLYHKTASS
jgi:hypothetical protein